MVAFTSQATFQKTISWLPLICFHLSFIYQIFFLSLLHDRSIILLDLKKYGPRVNLRRENKHKQKILLIQQDFYDTLCFLSNNTPMWLCYSYNGICSLFSYCKLPYSFHFATNTLVTDRYTYLLYNILS